MLARGRRLQPKRANLFARKSITYARASTEPAIRSRQLPSDFPRPGEPVSNCLRHRRERPRRGKPAAERNPIADRRAEDVLAAFPVPCGARAIRQHRVAPYRSGREVQPTAVPVAAAALPHERRREPASAPAAPDPGSLGDGMTFWPRISTGDHGCSAILCFPCPSAAKESNVPNPLKSVSPYSNRASPLQLRPDRLQLSFPLCSYCCSKELSAYFEGG